MKVSGGGGASFFFIAGRHLENSPSLRPICLSDEVTMLTRSPHRLLQFSEGLEATVNSTGTKPNIIKVLKWTRK